MTLHYKYDAAKTLFVSRHEILATGCISARRMASKSFKAEAYLAALCFVLERLDFAFVCEAAFDCVFFACDDLEDVWDEVRRRDELLL